MANKMLLISTKILVLLLPIIEVKVNPINPISFIYSLKHIIFGYYIVIYYH